MGNEQLKVRYMYKGGEYIENVDKSGLIELLENDSIFILTVHGSDSAWKMYCDKRR